MELVLPRYRCLVHPLYLDFSLVRISSCATIPTLSARKATLVDASLSSSWKAEIAIASKQVALTGSLSILVFRGLISILLAGWLLSAVSSQ